HHGGWLERGGARRRPSPRKPMIRRAPLSLICLAVTYIVGSSTYLAQRIATTGFPPLRMAGPRFFVAGPPPFPAPPAGRPAPPPRMAGLRSSGAASLLAAAPRARGAPPPRPREWGAAALSALPLLTLGIGGVAFAVHRVPSGLCALIFGSVPLWTAIFDRIRG